MPLGKRSASGTTLIRFVGGASGPLYGKLFVTVGKHLDEAGVVSQDTLVHAGEEAIRVLMALGRSDVGQKTMLDVLVPVLDELRSVRGADLLAQIRRRANSAALATVPLVARKAGLRSSASAARAHGPGARSSELIVSAVCRISNPCLTQTFRATNREQKCRIVIVSHSPDVAKGAADMVRQMVAKTCAGWCGVIPTASGTSVDAIEKALQTPVGSRRRRHGGHGRRRD